MTTQTTSYPRIVSQGEWLQAREVLLAKEKEHTHQREALSAARRELPWVTNEEMAAGKVNYNYEERGWEEYPAEDKHGLSVFVKAPDGQVFHTYSVYSRGCEDLLGIYTYLDLVPKGRDESLLPFPMAWMRHHDRYAATSESASG